jgi:hypothetical protein
LETIFTETSTPCYAWTLIPNHFHILLKTGNVPIATVMRRLLTGYAVSFNRRHRRYGHVFQNRYKSILCQEDAYMKELVRYIHLNPLRARLVTTLKELDRYPYSGHSRLMGKVTDTWQSADEVLGLFESRKTAARRIYRAFVEKGIAAGSRPDLIGGGLVRSAGGWGAVKAMRRLKIHIKSDERILGDSDFVDKVLAQASEEMEERYQLESMGYDFDRILARVSEVFNMGIDQVLAPGKQPLRVQVRSVLAYWAIKKLRLSAVETGRRMGISQSGASRAAQRGEIIAKDLGISMI